jgi:hypothetical protein
MPRNPCLNFFRLRLCLVTSAGLEILRKLEAFLERYLLVGNAMPFTTGAAQIRDLQYEAAFHRRTGIKENSMDVGLRAELQIAAAD